MIVDPAAVGRRRRAFRCAAEGLPLIGGGAMSDHGPVAQAGPVTREVRRTKEEHRLQAEDAGSNPVRSISHLTIVDPAAVPADLWAQNPWRSTSEAPRGTGAMSDHASPTAAPSRPYPPSLGCTDTGARLFGSGQRGADDLRVDGGDCEQNRELGGGDSAGRHAQTTLPGPGHNCLILWEHPSPGFRYPPARPLPYGDGGPHQPAGERAGPCPLLPQSPPIAAPAPAGRSPAQLPGIDNRVLK